LTLYGAAELCSSSFREQQQKLSNCKHMMAKRKIHMGEIPIKICKCVKFTKILLSLIITSITQYSAPVWQGSTEMTVSVSISLSASISQESYGPSTKLPVHVASWRGLWWHFNSLNFRFGGSNQVCN